MCPFPPDGGAVERLDPGSEGAGTPGTAQDDSAAEIAEVLNASLAGVCATWRPSLANRAAADLVAAGFRRVPEDAEGAQTLADVAREVRIEASLADRPGQMARLDEQAARIEVVITALRSVSGGGEQP